jgi:cell division protein FtsB
MTGLETHLPTRRISLRTPRSRGGILWLAVLLLVGSFLVVQVGRQVYASWAINQQVAQVREQIAGTKAQNAELQRELDFLRSPAYISEQARRLQNVGRSGEQVLIIPPGAEEPLPAALRPPVELPKPMLEQWVDLFFGH